MKVENYTITIYKSMECLKELEMISSIIDFGDCYKRVQQTYNLENRSLIILISDFFDNKKLTETRFYFFNPDTGETLSIEKETRKQSLFHRNNVIEYKFFVIGEHLSGKTSFCLKFSKV